MCSDGWGSVHGSVQRKDTPLKEYRRYLAHFYSFFAPSDKYSLTKSALYISLAMVHREDYNSKQRDEFTRQTLHGEVDQILKMKTPTSIDDLLAPDGTANQGPVKFVVVEGPPGIGKSTFAWEVCRRWDKIENLRKFDAVVLLKLREKWVANATSLSELFRYPLYPEYSKHIAMELEKSQGRDLLLVLDGFDEIPQSFPENSVVKSILSRQSLSECTTILTTRPSARFKLESVCKMKIDKHIEILGFTEEERVRYITCVFSTEPELQANFLKYMFLVPHIKSMMYIPLNCAIITQVYSESQSTSHLAIRRTRTQLYKALTHCLLVGNMRLRDTCASMLPEGLDAEDMEKFKLLAKFAFDSYHEGTSRKFTFSEEDVPEGLVHFGFMNECSEMFAGSGPRESTFSFLHLSLQEYLAAWYMAYSYSVEFQVAYHRLAMDELILYVRQVSCTLCKEERALLVSLMSKRESLIEPAIFLSGITGLTCQSEDGTTNLWEGYVSEITGDMQDPNLMVRCLYEAQSPTILSQCFPADESNNSMREVRIGKTYSRIQTPYDCYALSFCLTHSPGQFSLFVEVWDEEEISLVETFVKGLVDHCRGTLPAVKSLQVELHTSSLEIYNKCLLWLTRAKLCEVEELKLESTLVDGVIASNFLKRFHKLRSLSMKIQSPSWEWLSALHNLTELKVLHVSSGDESTISPSNTSCLPVHHKLSEIVLDINLPCGTAYDICNTADMFIHSLLALVLKSSAITALVLPNISRNTMSCMRNVLLHCPSLVTLKLKRTRLGYDGILYLCSALKTNKTLKHLSIHDSQVSESAGRRSGVVSFASLKLVPLPNKLSCSDFLLELDSILKENSTLESIQIESGLFLSLSAGERWIDSQDYHYCQWTGLGPLEQFNIGSVRKGTCLNLTRCYSLSDLTQPQTHQFWKRDFTREEMWSCYFLPPTEIPQIDFKKLFSWNREHGNKTLSHSSFTAPDTDVLQAFSSLDHRLIKCLELHHLNAQRLVGRNFIDDEPFSDY